MAKGKHILEANPSFTPKAYADLVQNVAGSVSIDWPGVVCEISVQPDFYHGDVYRYRVIVALYVGRDTDGVITGKTLRPSIADTPEKILDLVCRLVNKAFLATLEKRMHRMPTVTTTQASYRPSAVRLSA
jgi:hypothetical protein